MKQEEKSQKSRNHILTFAFAEFAAQGYAAGSINSICAKGNISKGLLYHCYTGKDALYLACVRQCFNDLTDHLSAALSADSVTPDLYFQTRLAFFQAHPQHQQLFYAATVTPPAHLEQELSALRAAFDTLNDTLLTAILKKEPLAKDISLEEALLQFHLLEGLFHTGIKMVGQTAQGPEQYTELCRRTFHTLLYGLIAR